MLLWFIDPRAIKLGDKQRNHYATLVKWFKHHNDKFQETFINKDAEILQLIYSMNIFSMTSEYQGIGDFVNLHDWYLYLQ